VKPNANAIGVLAVLSIAWAVVLGVLVVVGQIAGGL
jgi:hypothetical protein